MKIGQRARVRGFSALTTALTVTLMCSAAKAEDVDPKPTVTFIENAAQGRKITRADYESAIAGLEESGADGIGAFYTANNLCVSHLKLGNLDDARVACDDAVVRINALIDAPRRQQVRDVPSADRERFLAVALSNRGVANAAIGRAERALADFRAAIEADSRFSGAKTNLVWLAQRSISGA